MSSEPHETSTSASITPLAYSSSPTRRVLITGGSGFLGFRLATTLAAQGIRAVLLDLAPPRDPLPPGVTFIAGSVADPAAVDAAICASADDEPSDAGPSGRGGHTSGAGGASGGGASSTGGAVDAVFHVASYGMSGRELRNRALIEAVNVGGTRNVVEACLRRRVPRLVYVSTCNVIWVGRPIRGGDETAPYPPPCAYKDPYSATKARAERLVLEANGRPLRRSPAQGSEPEGTRTRAGSGSQLKEEDRGQDGTQTAATASTAGQDRGEATGRGRQGEQQERPAGLRLATCSVRSTGIWGAGETRHQPRVIRMVQDGLFLATFGDRNSIVDWIHVNNLVDMLILAERALRAPGPECVSGSAAANSSSARDAGSGPQPGGVAAAEQAVPVAAGQAYYASDGAPLNNFAHFKPIIEGLGYSWPALNMPYSVMYGIAALIEFTWPLLRYVVNDPLLIRMEVDKSCVEHWFDLGKARRQLGYEPKVYDRQEVVRQMAAEGWAATAPAAMERRRRRQRWLGMLAAALVAVMAAVLVGLVWGSDGLPWGAGAPR